MPAVIVTCVPKRAECVLVRLFNRGRGRRGVKGSLASLAGYSPPLTPLRPLPACRYDEQAQVSPSRCGCGPVSAPITSPIFVSPLA